MLQVPTYEQTSTISKDYILLTDVELLLTFT